ncbi:hypothetical protein [Candidatus Magnetaquicoccus inordinatus]|uniref:hypothetical protein n=1 Tax=Candidatus Magnetaquicoccus inordinatus TaxID=2496818 RepID=UPI00102C98E2|nr:hypothetical protein [Candidatus Magnetaquicoccus inordinatus]
MSNAENNQTTTETTPLCEVAQVEIGESGFSVCRVDHPVVGECLLEGIQDLGAAIEMVERLNAGEEESVTACAGAHGATALPCLSALQDLAGK